MAIFPSPSNLDAPQMVSATGDALRTKHKTIALLMISGMNYTEIAQQVGCTTATLHRLRQNPIFQAFVDGLEAKMTGDVLSIRQQIDALLPLAVEKLGEHLKSQDEKVSLAASRDLLDRGGYGKVDKSVQVRLDGDTCLDPERIKALRVEIGRLKDMGIVLPVGADNPTIAPARAKSSTGDVIEVQPITED